MSGECRSSGGGAFLFRRRMYTRILRPWVAVRISLFRRLTYTFSYDYSGRSAGKTMQAVALEGFCFFGWKPCMLGGFFTMCVQLVRYPIV